jgi:hypothetical protein
MKRAFHIALDKHSGNNVKENYAFSADFPDLLRKRLIFIKEQTVYGQAASRRKGWHMQ